MPATVEQTRHAKAMASKIKNHIQQMQSITDAIERYAGQVPVEVIEAKFSELENWWNEIQSVLTDMLPDLK